MKTLKLILTRFPEYYLLILALLTVYTPPFSFSMNPFVIGFIAVIILQIILRNKISGLIIAIMFTLINVYMLFALISEFSEFSTFNTRGKELIFGGLSIFILNLLMSVGMLYKYTQKTDISDLNLEYHIN